MKSTSSLCLEETRVSILDEIHKWGEGHGNDCIFWLNGKAGTGKSTIARTVAHHFHEKGRLGASFFFSKSQQGLGNASELFATMAIQLSDVLPNLKPYICESIQGDRNIGRKFLLEQWKHLILQPLTKLDKSILSHLVMVIVIDALDECEEGDETIHQIIQLLDSLRDLQVLQIRVLITSRPEDKIQRGFEKISKPVPVHRKLLLDQVDPEDIRHDISTFLTHQLDQIRKTKSLKDDWPAQKAIDTLVQKAGPLFIFAATICRFLSKSPFPDIRLDQILEGNSASRSATEELDKMYMMILKDLLQKGHDEDNEDMGRLFQQIVGSIVTLFETQAETSLSTLLAVPSTEMKKILGPLRSVLDIPEDQNSPIKLFHLSFRDFIVDKQRCLDPLFYINEKDAHGILFRSCLKVMWNQLRRDCCNLGRPGVLISEVEESKIKNFLPPDVRYACRYWIPHLKESKFELSDINKVLLFLEDHLLHWLEAMSLMRQISEGIIAMNSLESIVPVSSSV